MLAPSIPCRLPTSSTFAADTSGDAACKIAGRLPALQGLEHRLDPGLATGLTLTTTTAPWIPARLMSRSEISKAPGNPAAPLAVPPVAGPVPDADDIDSAAPASSVVSCTVKVLGPDKGSAAGVFKQITPSGCELLPVAAAVGTLVDVRPAPAATKVPDGAG
jgi:hypothetical protein